MNKRHSHINIRTANGIGRREFIRGSAIASAGLLLAPFAAMAGNGGTAECAPTTADIEGPYYLANSPMRATLAQPDEPGTRLVIAGTVYYNDCTTPVVGAIVDVWAANDAGCYNNNNECSPHGDDRYNLRGRMLTDAAGVYSYSTVKPGRYLNGNTYRPSHIHYKISSPGGPLVTTQLYFAGDPYIPSDAWASDPAAAGRIIELTRSGLGLGGIFDIVLNIPPHQSAVPIDKSAPRGSHLVSVVPNPAVATAAIEYTVAAGDRVDLAIYNAAGRCVRTLVSAMHGVGRFSQRWDGLDDGGNEVPSGMYTCRLRVGGMVETANIVLAR